VIGIAFPVTGHRERLQFRRSVALRETWASAFSRTIAPVAFKRIARSQGSPLHPAYGHRRVRPPAVSRNGNFLSMALSGVDTSNSTLRLRAQEAGP